MSKFQRRHSAVQILVAIPIMLFTQVNAQEGMIRDAETTATKYLDTYLEAAAKIDRRFSCWIEIIGAERN